MWAEAAICIGLPPVLSLQPSHHQQRWREQFWAWAFQVPTQVAHSCNSCRNILPGLWSHLSHTPPLSQANLTASGEILNSGAVPGGLNAKVSMGLTSQSISLCVHNTLSFSQPWAPLHCQTLQHQSCSSFLLHPCSPHLELSRHIRFRSQWEHPACMWIVWVVIHQHKSVPAMANGFHWPRLPWMSSNGTVVHVWPVLNRRHCTFARSQDHRMGSYPSLAGLQVCLSVPSPSPHHLPCWHDFISSSTVLLVL